MTVFIAQIVWKIQQAAETRCWCHVSGLSERSSESSPEVFRVAWEGLPPQEQIEGHFEIYHRYQRLIAGRKQKFREQWKPETAEASWCASHG